MYYSEVFDFFSFFWYNEGNTHSLLYMDCVKFKGVELMKISELT